MHEVFVFLAETEIFVNQVAIPFRYGTDDVYWDGQSYLGRILQAPEFTQALGGIIVNSSISLSILDEQPMLMPYYDNLVGSRWTIQGVNTGTSQVVYSALLECSRFTWADGVFTLEMIDAEPKAWERLYPEFTYKADDWPNLLEQDSGAAIPYVAGLGLKLRMVFLDDNEGEGPWRYGIAQVATSGTASVLNIYRGSEAQAGAIVNESEYTLQIDSVAGADGTYLLLSAFFNKEQRDFSGDLYYLSADVKYGDAEQIDANEELERLLIWAGIGSFQSPITPKAGEIMSYGYGWNGVQKTIRATIEPILQILKASLIVTGNGQVTLIKDEAKGVSASYPVLEDTVAFDQIGRETPPARVELEYWPSVYRPGELIHRQSRTIPGGIGTETYSNLYLRNHVAADRLCDYLAKRHRYNFEATMSLYHKDVSLGDRIDPTGNNIINTRTFTVTTFRRDELKTSIGIIEYNDNLFNYEAGTLPGDPNEGYKPDYSGTMPDEPSGLRVSSVGWVSDLVTITVDAFPPTVNFRKLVFGVQKLNATIEWKDGTELTNGRHEATFYGIPGGSEVDIAVYAENAFGVAGNVADMTWTAPADSSPPPLPTGVSLAWVLQNTNEYKGQILWEESTAEDISHYTVRRAGGTSHQATGTTFLHPDIIAGGPGSETYYVKAHDLSGNQSGEQGVTKARPTDGTPPAYPTGFQSTVTNIGDNRNIIDLSWNANTETDLDHYEWREGTGTWSSTTDTSVRAGTDYPSNTTQNFELVAVDTSDNRSAIATRTVFVPADDNPPARPTSPSVSFSAVQDNRYNATVSWTLSTSTDISYYSIQEHGGVWLTVNGTQNSVTFDTVTPGNTFRQFDIIAVDTFGNQSAPAVRVGGTTPTDTIPPPQPYGLSHQNLYYDNYQTANRYQTLFQWNYPAPPADLVGFRSQRILPSVGAIVDLDKNLRSAISTELLYSNQTAAWDIWAYDEAGNESSKVRYQFTVPGDTVGPHPPAFTAYFRWTIWTGSYSTSAGRVRVVTSAGYEPADWVKYVAVVNHGDGNPTPPRYDIPGQHPVDYEIPRDFTTGYSQTWYIFMAGVDSSGNEGPASSYTLTF